MVLLVFNMVKHDDNLFSDYYFRMFSHYKHVTITMRPPPSFHDVSMSAMNAFNQCCKKQTVRSCAYNSTINILLRASLYSVFMKDYLEAFPPNQIFVARGEDYYANRTAVFDKLTNFLGIGECVELEKGLLVNYLMR